MIFEQNNEVREQVVMGAHLRSVRNACGARMTGEGRWLERECIDRLSRAS